MDRIDFIYYMGKKLRVLKSEKLIGGRPTAEPNREDIERASDHAAVMTTFKIMKMRQTLAVQEIFHSC